MNIVQLQEQLKNFSQDQLVREMQMPSGTAPQFLVLGEIMRRQKMQQDFANRQAQGAPQSTVAEDAIASAGVPQGGIADMARALAPQTNMAENTGVQAMAAGGMVKKMAKGGAASTDPAIIAMANRVGMPVDKYLRAIGEEHAAKLEESAARRALRNRMVAMEPIGDGLLFPTQEDLDLRYAAEQAREPVFPDSGFSEPVEILGVGSSDGKPRRRPASSDMTTVGSAIAAGTARGGRGGIADALLASRELVPEISAVMPPDPADVRAILAGREEPYFPGPAAATELNLPAIRALRDGNAGLATGLRAAAENYQPPVEPGAGRAGPVTGMEGGVGALSPLDMQMQGLALAQDVLESRAGTITGKPQGTIAPQYEAGTLFDPVTGVPISGGGVVGETPASPVPLDPRLEAAIAAIPDQLKEQGISDGTLDMAAEAKKSAEEAAAMRDAAGITRSKDAPAPKEAAPASTASTASASSSGGIAGGGGMSSYEQELMDVLQRREKAAEQDKWLALAQVGLNMMSSTQPTLLGAVGEAGLKGVEAARSARDQYDKDRLELLGAIEQSRMARAAAAAKAAGGAGGLTAYQAATLGRYARQDAISMLGTLYDRLGTLAPTGIPLPETAADYERTKAQIAAIENDLYGDVGTEAGESYDLTQ